VFGRGPYVKRGCGGESVQAFGQGCGDKCIPNVLWYGAIAPVPEALRGDIMGYLGGLGGQVGVVLQE